MPLHPLEILRTVLLFIHIHSQVPLVALCYIASSTCDIRSITHIQPSAFLSFEETDRALRDTTFDIGIRGHRGKRNEVQF